MSVLIIGGLGNMGSRYKAILRYLGKDFEIADKNDTHTAIKEAVKRSNGVIITTPTDTHLDYIKLCLPYRIPIMCEKPITKNVVALKELLAEVRDAGTPFRMVNQYKMLVEANRLGPTAYNYWRTGNDGLIWDCIQIIGLSRGNALLQNTSPIWRCKINGQILKIQDMDAAYVGYMQQWFKEPNQDPGEILATHEKTAKAERMAANG